MAFKLNSQETKTRAALAEELRSLAADVEEAVEQFNSEADALWSDLAAAIEEFNAKRAEAFQGVESAINAYNEKLDEARGLRDDVAGRLEDEWSEKSEKWQESDKGEAASNMKTEWENADLDDFEIEEIEEIEIDEPGELEAPDLTHADLLEELPDEAS